MAPYHKYAPMPPLFPHNNSQAVDMGRNTGETGGGSNDDGSRHNIKSRLDNRFERYLSLRGSGGEESSNTSNADIYNINTTTVQQEDDGNWNHVTSPFKSTSKSSSLIDKTTESSTSPSFTNVVRSQTVDRFSNIFMERISNVMSSVNYLQHGKMVVVVVAVV